MRLSSSFSADFFGRRELNGRPPQISLLVISLGRGGGVDFLIFFPKGKPVTKVFQGPYSRTAQRAAKTAVFLPEAAVVDPGARRGPRAAAERGGVTFRGRARVDSREAGAGFGRGG